MPVVTYIAHDGSRHTAELTKNTSAMSGAVGNGIPGILGDCGGSCSCATCHVYVAPDWRAAVGPASGEEEELLFIRDDRRPESRLSCQITVTATLDGLVLHMPAEQY